MARHTSLETLRQKKAKAQEGLTAMRNRPTLFRAAQSSAEQRRAAQSRAESRGYNCVLFAPCVREAFETEYYIRDG